MTNTAPPFAFLDVAAIIVEGPRLSPGAKVVQRLAELVRVARAVGVERPARLPGDDVVREFPHVEDRVLDRGDGFAFTPCHERDAGRLELFRGFLKGLLRR